MNIQCAYEVHMSPVLSGSSVLECVKIGDAFKIRDGQFLIQDCHIHVLKYSLLYAVLSVLIELSNSSCGIYM